MINNVKDCANNVIRHVLNFIEVKSENIWMKGMIFILNGVDHQNVSPTWRFTHPTHRKPVGEHSWDLDFLFFCSSKNKEILLESPIGFTIEQKGLKRYKMTVIVIGALFDFFFFFVSCGPLLQNAPFIIIKTLSQLCLGGYINFASSFWFIFN